MRYVNLQPGDPAPWIVATGAGGQAVRIDAVAGRWLVLCFFGSAGVPALAARLAALTAEPGLYDGERVAFFGLSVDPADRARLKDGPTGIRFLQDADGSASRRYGAAPELEGQGEGEGAAGAFRPQTVILDPGLRVFDRVDFADPGHDERILAAVRALPDPAAEAPGETPGVAPVLMLPRVFEPEFCRELITCYERRGGTESGFMREVGGKTVPMYDRAQKSRTDCVIEDEALRLAARRRIERRVLPEIRKAFNFHATRLERYIVAAYDADAGGHFRPHRDNTTGGTAHRRFAVTINLDAEAYEGGELVFPEFGRRTYRPPTGGAVVFSCSLLHGVTRVTSGRRYAFLPFLYDDAAAALRERNNALLAEGVGRYRPDRG